jgi:hypothetical protein
MTFRNRLIFYGEELLAPRPTPSWRTTPCRLSATAYSIYLQLPSISGGRLLHPQPEDAPCRGDKGPTHKFLERLIIGQEFLRYEVKAFISFTDHYGNERRPGDHRLSTSFSYMSQNISLRGHSVSCAGPVCAARYSFNYVLLFQRQPICWYSDGLDRRSSIPGKGTIFSSPKRPDRL